MICLMKYFIQTLIMIVMSMSVITSCNSSEKKENNSNTKILKQAWGETDGKQVDLYTLTNTNGVQVKIANYGGTVTSWITPDKNANKNNVVLGFDSLGGYLAKPSYFGALIGCYGNRIGKGVFKIDTTTYHLATNNGENHLHGGNKGFDKVVWDAVPSDSTASLTLSYLSKDGEEGYPGNLKVTVMYALTDNDELVIDYSAETDKPTVVNLTNHSYFNLTGDVTNSILNHEL